MKSKTLESPQTESLLVVEASAGSGKTYALAKRYLQLITSQAQDTPEANIKNILAVTFTNKATFEMKQRILEFLKRTALDGPTKDKRLIANRIMDDILTNYNFFQVQTIDSFINNLLTGCSFHLRLASNFSIKEDYGPYLKYGFDRLIERAHHEKQVMRVFDAFLDYYLFIENRDSWFSKDDILALIEALYNYSHTYGGGFTKPEAAPGELRKKKRSIQKLIEQLAHDVPEATDKRFINTLNNLAENPGNRIDINTLSNYFSRKEFPIKKGADIPAKVSRLWDRLRRDLKEFCELESYVVFGPYIEIFNMVLDEFKELSARDDIIFLQELNTYAKSLVSEESITVAEFYYRLATRFRHYLIDEFQDTSRLQWRNISPLVEEALASGGSLFYVGDKKQAIYRFRGGDLSLFDSVQSHFSDFNSRPTILGQNYRSQKEIVEFNNRVFSPQNLERFILEAGRQKTPAIEFGPTDIETATNIFQDSKQQWLAQNQKGYVEIKTIDTSNADEKKAITRRGLIGLIRDLQKRFSFSDMAILARENRDVKLFTSWLIEESIPVESEKTLNIREHHLIRELVSFLKFLDSPIDNLAFAAFITGGIFQAASGIKGSTIQDFIFNLRTAGKEKRRVYLYREFKRSFPDAWSSLIEGFFKSVGFVPIYELMITILSKYEVLQRSPEYQGFVMKFLEFIKENESEYTGLGSFLEYFEEAQERQLYVNVANTSSVTITTTHKAKGLEFGVVIIPFLEIDVTVGTGGGNTKKPYVIRQGKDSGLSLVQLKRGYGSYSEKLKAEYKAEYLKSLIDELNNLYVALTRARYEVYAFVPERCSNKKNIARNLIPLKPNRYGKQIEYPDKTRGVKSPLIELSPSHYSDWIGALREDFIGASELINRDNITRGNIFHLILSCVGNLCTENKPQALRDAAEKVRQAFPHTKGIEQYISTIAKMLEEERFKQFFYIKDGKAYQEKEVIDASGNTKRIDRLVVRPNETWVIDYKSSRDGFDTHIEQLRDYMDILKALYPGSRHKGFLIYLDTLTIEEIDG